MKYWHLLFWAGLGCAEIAPAELRVTPCSMDADCLVGQFCHRDRCLRRERVCDNDGLQETGEACDDGNDRNDDSCTTQCELARCGDGILRTDLAAGHRDFETCEPGNSTQFYCDDRCRAVQRPHRLRAYRHKTCWVVDQRVRCWGVPNGSVGLPARFFDSPWVVPNEFTAASLYDSGKPHRVYVRESSGLVIALSDFNDASFHLEFASPAVPTTRAISLAPTHGCAAQDDPFGTICWDLCVPGFGQKFWSPQEDASLVLDVAVSQYIACSLTDAYDVNCWGGEELDSRVQPCLRREPYLPMWLTGVRSLSANLTSFVALHHDGRVSQWSGRWSGVGERDQDAEIHAVNLPEPAQQVVSMVGRHCAVLTSGRVACWYASDARQITERSPFLVDGLEDVVSLSEGSYAEHLCAQKSDRSIWCWGKNDWGQLGDGTSDDQRRPVRASIVDYDPVSPWDEP